MQRVCGGCTACCKTHGVLELWKLPGTWCPYCSVGKGCAAYERRPAECRHFKCSWLLGMGNEEHRPDRINVVPEVREIGDIAKALWLFELTEGALESLLVKRWTLNNLTRGTSVMHVSLIRNPRLYLSEGTPPPKNTLVFSPREEEIQVVAFPEFVRSLI